MDGAGTAALDLKARRDNVGVFEYACHEGNYGLRNMLSTARYLERQTAAPTSLASDRLQRDAVVVAEADQRRRDGEHLGAGRLQRRRDGRAVNGATLMPKRTKRGGSPRAAGSSPIRVLRARLNHTRSVASASRFRGLRRRRSGSSAARARGR